MEFETVIKGGTINTIESSFVADIGVAGGKVAAIGSDLDGITVIQAAGLQVIPGAIDVHTHFATEVGGHQTADDYESGSRAAAAGGITSFINFAFQEHGQSLQQAVDTEYQRALGRSYLDFGVHAVVTDPSAMSLDSELQQLAERGVTSLKIFTAVEGFELRRHQILEVLEAAARAQMIVAVHAEDGALVAHLTAKLLAEGKRSVAHLPNARPPESEAVATSMVSQYAGTVGCPVYFVHLSCRKALDAVREARRQGVTVYVETRPAYLFLDRSRYELPNFEGNKFVCWPPLRSPDDQAALWEGLRNGEIQTYATDHTTWMASQKMRPDLSFQEIPGGVANVQTSVGMLFNEGVRKGRISMRRFIEVTSANPARLFGMWPQKGTIAAGSDADITIIDPQREIQIVSSEMESRSDFDPYEGWRGIGWPVLTMARGEVIVQDGKVVGKLGSGRPLQRKRYEPL
ncbi:MAG: dihydropyrimidinase [Candidatus Dormibacteraceae bacterium]